MRITKESEHLTRLKYGSLDTKETKERMEKGSFEIFTFINCKIRNDAFLGSYVIVFYK